VTLLLAGIALAVLLSLAAVLVIRRSLGSVLADICRCRERGTFWATLSCLCIFIAGVFAGLPTVGTTELLEGRYPLLALTTQAKYCLLGLFGSLVVVSAVVLRFINRFPVPPRTLNEETWDQVRRELFGQAPQSTDTAR
jgi:hypothetical protein